MKLYTKRHCDLKIGETPNLSIYVVVGNVNMSPTLRKIKHYNPMQEKVPSIYQATGASQLIENFSEGVLQCDFYVELVWVFE